MPAYHQDDTLITIQVAARLKRWGGEVRLIIPAGGQAASEPRPNAPLIQALQRAHVWKAQLLSCRVASIRAIAESEHLPERYVGTLLRLAFLAPDITQAFLEGRQPPDLDLKRLQRGVALARSEQRQALGFTQAS